MAVVRTFRIQNGNKNQGKGSNIVRLYARWPNKYILQSSSVVQLSQCSFPQVESVVPEVYLLSNKSRQVRTITFVDLVRSVCFVFPQSQMRFPPSALSIKVHL